MTDFLQKFQRLYNIRKVYRAIRESRFTGEAAQRLKNNYFC